MIHDQINVAMKKRKGKLTFLFIIMAEINVVEINFLSECFHKK
jgi:hypothetical protein